MKPKWWHIALLLVGCLIGAMFVAAFVWVNNMRRVNSLPPKEAFAAQEHVLQSAQGTEERFYALRDAAKMAVNAGEYGKAQAYATELLRAAPEYRTNWNYGNAIHDGNMVLGRVALATGDKQSAINYLLAAGKTPGSPQLDSFGPNMSLARDLIAKGVKPAVIAYFDECKVFWTDDNGRLDTWKSAVGAGQMPDFGANLRF